MKRCPTCGLGAPDGAMQCVECGFAYDVPAEPHQTVQQQPPVEAKGSALHGCAGLLIAIMVVAWVGSFFGCDIGTDRDIEAFMVAERAVKQRLLSPSTAQFSAIQEGVVEWKDDEVIVAGWVDSQNVFGGTVRNYWAVQMVSDASGFDVIHVELRSHDQMRQ